MFKQEESSTSPKEEEKLRQRLKSLIKQHELKHNKKETKNSPKKNQRKEEQQSQKYVNGELETKQKKKLNNKIKSKKVKGGKDGSNSNRQKEPNGLANAGTSTQEIRTERKAPDKNNESEFNNISSANKAKKKPNKLNKKANSQLPLATAQPQAEKVQQIPTQQKKMKSKKAAKTKQKEADASQTQATKNSITVPLTNGQQKPGKGQKKKAKKRAAAAANIQTNDPKKLKLVQEEVFKKDNTKSKKNPKKKNVKGLSKNSVSTSGRSSVAAGDEFDVSNMSGFVKGGDFDSDYAGDTYWTQQYADIYKENESDEDEVDDSNDNESSGDEDDDDVKKHFSQALHEHKICGEEADDDDESGDDPYNYSDMEDVGSDNDPYDYSDIDEDEEEEEEHYSDFDEDDYEEDDDSYDYSSDSELSSNFEEHDVDDDTGKAYDFNDEECDEDYKLPENVPEDMIIHSGTATKRDLQPEDNVVFKDKKYCQVIELEEQETVKIVQQPDAYHKEELLKLTYRENHTVKLMTAKEDEATKTCAVENNDCPKLVPIVDEDGFQLYNPNEDDEDEDEDEYDEDEDEYDEEDEDLEEEQDCSYDYEEDSSMDSVSLGSEYTELDSDEADSLMSEDINDKYLNRGNDDDDCYSSDEGVKRFATLKSADVIDATDCVYAGEKKNSRMEDSGESLQDEDISQLPSQQLYKHVNVGSKGSILTTTIVEQQQSNDEDSNGEESSSNTEELHETFEIEGKQSFSSEIAEECQVASAAKELSDKTSKVFEIDSKLPPEQTKQSAKRSKSSNSNQRLTDYNTIFCNAINANLVLVLLKDPFYVYGTVRLTLLAGTVKVYGHSLVVNKEVEIFSPRGCSVVEIAPTSSKGEKATLKDALKNYESNFVLADLENIIKSYEVGNDAVVLMKRNEERKKVVQQFNKFMNENVFPNLQNINMDRPLYNSEYLLRCMVNTCATEQKCLRLPDQWQKLAVTAKSRVMLAGGKGVGKSTLLRYLINKHIPQTERVLLIDLDIGQPEIFLPQTVSCSIVRKPLLGPGFFLNIQPEKSYAVGHTNIALCPHKYLAAVQQLIGYCLSREDFKGIPWFVNTMGYNKGFGLELISVIVKALPLTDVVQLQSSKDINNFESLLFPHSVSKIPRNMFVEDVDGAKEKSPHPSYRLHVWQSAVSQESRYQKEWGMSPTDLRYAMLLTRLSEALPGHADWLTDSKPLSAPLDQLNLVNLMDNIPPCSKDELAQAMEANLVYLCHQENDLNSVECLGIGVVRAIDYHVRQVYLLPAMPTALLKQVNCLALGDMPLPNTMFTNQGSRVKNTAPFVYNTIEANASKAIKQIYRRPKSFLSGKRRKCLV